MRFYVGLHHPADAHRFARSTTLINTLRNRQSGFAVGEWMLDRGAFTELATHGRYRKSPEVYAAQGDRWPGTGRLVAAVSQDRMCEPFMLMKTGLSVRRHQKLTIERYDRLRGPARRVFVLPVLQGYDPADYLRHIAMYGDRLRTGMRVGVGSVCKRNGKVGELEAVLAGIKQARPDLRVHGFGVKLTALGSASSGPRSGARTRWRGATRPEERGGAATTGGRPGPTSRRSGGYACDPAPKKGSRFGRHNDPGDHRARGGIRPQLIRGQEVRPGFQWNSLHLHAPNLNQVLDSLAGALEHRVVRRRDDADVRITRKPVPGSTKPYGHENRDECIREVNVVLDLLGRPDYLYGRTL